MQCSNFLWTSKNSDLTLVQRKGQAHASVQSLGLILWRSLLSVANIIPKLRNCWYCEILVLGQVTTGLPIVRRQILVKLLERLERY